MLASLQSGRHSVPERNITEDSVIEGKRADTLLIQEISHLVIKADIQNPQKTEDFPPGRFVTRIGPSHVRMRVFISLVSCQKTTKKVKK